MTLENHAAGAGGKEREAALRVSVITGLLDSGITMTAMAAARSSVLLADALKTLLEFVAVLLSWLAMRRINKGSRQFEYGMGKMENLVSLLVGTLMTVCLLIIVVNAVRNILHPSHIGGIGVWIGVADQIIYVFINSFLCVRSFRRAKAEASPLLQSQARLLLTRAIGNAFILVSLGLSMALRNFGWASYIDPVASLVIAISIMAAAGGIFSSSIYDLLDRTLEESDQILILRELARHFDDYEALHGIRSRRSGSEVFIEILLEFDPEKNLGEAQKVIDDLRRSLQEKIRGSRVTIGLTTEPV